MSFDRSHLHVVRDGADAPALPVLDDIEELDATGTELEPVIEAEVVRAPRHRRTLDRPVRVINIVGREVQVRPSERTVRVARAAATVGVGWHSWMTRAGDAATMGVYRRQIRIAEATGDREALGEWMDRKERAVSARRNRLMDLPLLAVNLAKFLGISLVGALVLLLALSTAVWATGVGEFSTVWELTGGLIRLILNVLTYAWPAIPLAVVAAAWKEGNRRRGEARGKAVGEIGRASCRERVSCCV